LKKEMQTVMSQKVGIFKTTQSLTEAENEFEGFYEQVKKPKMNLKDFMSK
jgi:succinate dehydrogenase/fumarate reductase flavoprotein subunit